MKPIKVFLIIFIINNIILCCIIYHRNITKKPSLDKVIINADSIESELSNIEIKRDSINKKIDTIFIELKTIEKVYEEKHNNILSNSTNDDYAFFTDYIERNSSRLDSINNF